MHQSQVCFIQEIRGWSETHKSINVIHHTNRLNDRSHMIMSSDSEKSFDKNQTSIYDKSYGENMDTGEISQCTGYPELTSS